MSILPTIKLMGRRKKKNKKKGGCFPDIVREWSTVKVGDGTVMHTVCYLSAPPTSSPCPLHRVILLPVLPPFRHPAACVQTGESLR